MLDSTNEMSISDHIIYVPILKWKRGEQYALEKLPADIKKRVLPLLEIVPVPYDYANEVEAKTIAEHLEPIANNIQKSWGLDAPVLIDLYMIEEYEKVDDIGTHPFQFIADNLTAKGCSFIPVTGINRAESYQEAVKILTTNGVCIRITDEDLIGDFNSGIEALLTRFSLGPQQVDLLVDFRYVSPSDEARSILSASMILKLLPKAKAWRRLVFSCSAFPENLSNISSTNRIRRIEWHLWKKLYDSRNSLEFFPIYSDYGISHPYFADYDPRVMTMSANIRYTSKNDFLIFKGKSIKKHGWGQIRALAQELVSHPEYAGKDYSWGDNYIYNCATNPNCTTGNAETWRRVGTNHHITFVVNQISSLHDS